MEARILAKHNIRSKTNGGDLCKQTFELLIPVDESVDAVLNITKLVLTDKFELHEKYGFKFLKEYKDKRLYLQGFAIKLKTLEEVGNWLNKAINKHSITN